MASGSMANGFVVYTLVGPTGGYNTCTVHQCCAAKVTILMVMSVSNPDMLPFDVMSSCNLEWSSVCVPLSKSQ